MIGHGDGARLTDGVRAAAKLEGEAALLREECTGCVRGDGIAIVEDFGGNAGDEVSLAQSELV